MTNLPSQSPTEHAVLSPTELASRWGHSRQHILPTERAALSPLELASRWGNSRQHIYDLIHEGKLKAFYSGRHLRITLEEIVRIESGEAA